MQWTLGSIVIALVAWYLWQPSVSPVCAVLVGNFPQVPKQCCFASSALAPPNCPLAPVHAAGMVLQYVSQLSAVVIMSGVAMSAGGASTVLLLLSPQAAKPRASERRSRCRMGGIQ